jgi:hypothetical protein
MGSTPGSQLANLIQSAVQALAERGFDPRQSPLDVPAEAAGQIGERLAALSESAGEAGLKAMSLLVSSATAALEKVSAMDPAAIENSKLGKALDELVRRAGERREGKWL